MLTHPITAAKIHPITTTIVIVCLPQPNDLVNQNRPVHLRGKSAGRNQSARANARRTRTGIRGRVGSRSNLTRTMPAIKSIMSEGHLDWVWYWQQLAFPFFFIVKEVSTG